MLSQRGGRLANCKSSAEAAAIHAVRMCAIARPNALSRTNGRIRPEAVIEYAVTGLLAWWGGEPGQVGNEAATIVFRQCRGSGSSPFLSPRSSGVFVSAAISVFLHVFPVVGTVWRVGATRRY
ncbi:hypothetical protein BVI2075_600019 [Burkholderia vietnamiensis]|nr:hypothetical protein BVI1335_2420002 [Burkholderia vietnamiensis]CAG9215458.1 hypothetical protein BVI2075_600019 [Burkholderia vietnamiensis]